MRHAKKALAAILILAAFMLTAVVCTSPTFMEEVQHIVEIPAVLLLKPVEFLSTHRDDLRREYCYATDETCREIE